jgi:PAS domain S-box-containing protein
VAEPPPQPPAQLEEFFDLSIDLLCVVGFDGRFERMNPALARTLGYPPQQLAALTALDVTHPDDVERSQVALSRLAEGEDLVGFESRVICADGSVRWLEWNTRTVPDRGIVYGVARDTTERRRADEALREAQRLLERSHDELRALADQQTALRQVAELVARRAPDQDVFELVVEQATVVVGSAYTLLVRLDEDDSATTLAVHDAPPVYHAGQRQPIGNGVVGDVARTGRSARRTWRAPGLDRFLAERVDALGIVSAAGAPVLVDDRVWGVLVTFSQTDELPDTTERRLEGFARLGGLAIANTDARRELARLAHEQAALRRVATLVAREVPPEEIFAAVGREVGEVLAVDATHLGRFDGAEVVSVAQWGTYEGVPLGARFPLEGDNVSTRVLATRRPARIDGYDPSAGVIAATVYELGLRVAIGVPILVDGRPWGVMIASSKREHPFPPDTEARLQDFTELLATAIANASARDRLRRLAEEQAALRRVATLVARQTPQAEVFGAIAEEVGRLLGVDAVSMVRFEEGAIGVVVGGAGALAEAVRIGSRLPLEGRTLSSEVFRTGRAARFDDYPEQATGPFADDRIAAEVRSGVGTPIMVEGRMWGAMVAVTRDAPLPPDVDDRIGQFTELMATAIGNAEARAEVARLVDEQGALRRVATLVAQGAAPSAVFDAVTREVAELLDASSVTLARYDDEQLTVVASGGRVGHVAVGQRYPLGGTNVTSTVFETGRTARMDDYAAATGTIGDVARSERVRSVVAAPVMVEGGIWGVLAAVWSDRPPPPDDTAQRMSSFAELLDTAIANADSRDQLTESRARVLLAGDEARRRVARDLHDGAQQRLVQTVVTLKLAHRALRDGDDTGNAERLVAEALCNAEDATSDLRDLARGILPTVLTSGGLRAAVEALVSRLDVPIDVDVPLERLPTEIEASAYFVVAEALTNVVKHAHAGRASVRAAVEGDELAIAIQDDGVGGADPHGQGLLGLADRVDALGGTLRIDSAEHGGTVVSARLPLSTRPAGTSNAG